MKIENVTIENTGPFRAITVDFHPGWNVITGINASGKSLLLQAPYYLLHSVGTGSDRASNLQQYFTREGIILATVSGMKPSSCELILAVDPTKDSASVRLDGKSTVHHNVTPFIEPFRRLGDQPLAAYISAHRGAFGPCTVSHKEMLSKSWRAQETSARFQRLRTLFEIIRSEPDFLDERLQEVMREHFCDDNGPLAYIRKARLRPNTAELATDIHSLGANHEVGSAASGSTEVLFAVGETGFLKKSVIIFDEPELHLHPKGQDMMANYLYHLTTADGGENQVIVATHSLSFIYGHDCGKVINLRKDGDTFVGETIVENNRPTDAYPKALAELGYSKDAFMGARNFHKEYRKKHPKGPTSPAWDHD